MLFLKSIRLTLLDGDVATVAAEIESVYSKIQEDLEHQMLKLDLIVRIKKKLVDEKFD